MELIIVGFSIILIALYGSRAVMMHRGYKDQLYAALFSSYLEYFFRNAIRHDCSTSNLVKSKLGTHKMSFTTIQDREGQVTSRFVIIIYNKGIACISYLNPHGILHGKMSDKSLMIQREDRKFKILNPMMECKKYSNRIKKLCPNLNVQEYVACSDDSTLTSITGNIYHYKDVLDTLKAVNLPYISEEAIIEEYQNLTKEQK